MINEANDIPKYRKKSTAKPPKKSSHKHIYEPCLLEIPALWYCKPHERKNSRSTYLIFRSYCPICGKIGDVDRDRWRISEKRYSDSGPYIETVLTEEGVRELNPATRTLSVFKVDSPFDKFVDINKE